MPYAVAMDVLTRFAVDVWSLIGEMAPYLLFGFLLAGILSVLVRPERVERHLGRRGLRQILKATLVGVPMPLCSCGVIPVAASLRRHGASRGATAAFLASTPQTGVDSIAATWGLLGPLFTVVRVLVAFVSGIVAGIGVNALGDGDEKSDPAVTETHGLEGGSGSVLIRILRYGFVTLPGDIGRALLVGLLVAGALGVLPLDKLPVAWLHDPVWSVGIMTLFAIPVYVCSTGSIPVAVAFMASGVPPGAVLVFLVAGPATNAATISTLMRVMGRKAAALYVASIIATAWLAAWLVSLLKLGDQLEHEASAVMRMGGSTWKHAAAIVLLLVLAHARWRSRRLDACVTCEGDGQSDELSGEKVLEERG